MAITTKKIYEIIALNEAKTSEFQTIYNPALGHGSPISRFKFQLTQDKHILLPSVMQSLQFIKDLQRKEALSAREAKMVKMLRLKFDFEYWAFLCVKIQDKTTKKLTPFILRKPQLKLLKILTDELFSNKPIRIILLKARQWGGSTLVQIFMAWIQLFHRRSWHSVVVADVEDQSRNIKSMYTRLAQNHPQEVSKVTFSNFEGSTKNKKIKERDCIIYLASMQKPDALRSADVMMAHLSEVGLWKETEGKKPEDLVQSIAGTVPLEPYSMIVMESTAKGVGNFFHREWQKANSGESGYTPVFVAWYEIEMYQKPFASDDERLEFILSMTDKEHYCFELGATLEAINWYRNKKYTDSYDDWRMGCEFPTTPEEAFQSTGKRAHSPSYVGRMRKFCMPPLYKGDIFASAEYGKEALVDLKFEQVNNGFIWLWALPDTSINVTHRYVVSMDIGGRTDSADWSVISIIDRYWLSDGGVEECIGTARFHLDQDLAIWKATQIARFYNNALLVVEANSLNSKGTEGDHTLTILDEIRNYYDNIYYRIDTQRLKENLPVRYGFHTNRSTKTDLVNQMNKRFREMLHIERDHRALDEADYYEIKQNGSYGAVDGGHDDIYMSRAIGLKASDSLPIPKTIEQPSPRSTNPYKRSSCKNAPLFK